MNRFPKNVTPFPKNVTRIPKIVTKIWNLDSKINDKCHDKKVIGILKGDPVSQKWYDKFPETVTPFP